MWILAILLACSGGDDDTTDSMDAECETGDTGDASCGGGAGGDDDDDDDDDQSGFFADASFSSGEANSLEGQVISGGYNGDKWTLAALGDNPTHSVTFAIESSGLTGPATFALDDYREDAPGLNKAAYIDSIVGLENGSFGSTSGSLVVTEVVSSTRYGQEGVQLSGTFVMEMTNVEDPKNPPPVPLTATVSGSFDDIFIYEAVK